MDIDSLLISILKKNSGSLADKSIVPKDDTISFRKIAFDLYRVDNDPYDGLWVSKEVDGRDFLVRTDDPQYHYEDRGSWSAITNHDKDNITLSYKNAPIASFSSNDFGFNDDNIMSFKDALLDKISADNKFFNEVMGDQPNEKLTAILETFPELKEGVGNE